MAYLGWGKPRIFYSLLGDNDATTTWHEMPTPAEGTSELQTTKGDKQEAKIEGGENEDVRYAKSTYVFSFDIRAAKGRTKPIPDSDGLVTGNYAICVQPEDPTVNGFKMSRTTVSVENLFNTSEGGVWRYTFDALKPADNSDQVKWGVITVTESGGNISEVSFEDANDEE